MRDIHFDHNYELFKKIKLEFDVEESLNPRQKPDVIAKMVHCGFGSNYKRMLTKNKTLSVIVSDKDKESFVAKTRSYLDNLHLQNPSQFKNAKGK